MASEEFVSAEEAQRLLDGTTQRPWATYDVWCDPPTSGVSTDAPGPDGRPVVIARGMTAADARLCEIAPDMAHTLIAQAKEIARLRAVVDNVRAEREARVAWLESQPRDVGNGPVPDALLPLLEAELRTGLLIEELDEFDAQNGGAR